MRGRLIATVGLLMAFSVAAATPRKVARLSAKPATQISVEQPHTIPTSGDLSAADLIAVGKLAIADSDQFSDDPSVKYVGRQFLVTIPATALSTSYDKDTNELKVSTRSYEEGYELRRDETRSEYVGQNGYGARTTVTKVRGYAYGIEYPGERYEKQIISYSAHLDASPARDLSKALSLRVTALIIPADGIYAKKGSIFFEHHIISDATVSDPYDDFILRYYIACKYTKAEWVDTRTGAVLKTDSFGS